MSITIHKQYRCFNDTSESPTEISFVFKNKGGYGIELFLSVFPTQNCQVASISPMQYILSNLNKEEIKIMLSELQKKTNNPFKLLLVDVKAHYKDDLIKMFKEEIIFLNDYTSTNGSFMSMGLINIRSFINKK